MKLSKRLGINLEALESEDGSLQVSGDGGRKANNFLMKRSITPLCLIGMPALSDRREKRWRIFLPLSKRDLTT